MVAAATPPASCQNGFVGETHRDCTSQSSQAAIDCNVIRKRDILLLGCHRLRDLHMDALLLTPPTW